jgi:hypothetical protein
MLANNASVKHQLEPSPVKKDDDANHRRAKSGINLGETLYNNGEKDNSYNPKSTKSRDIYNKIVSSSSTSYYNPNDKAIQDKMRAVKMSQQNGSSSIGKQSRSNSRIEIGDRSI